MAWPEGQLGLEAQFCFAKSHPLHSCSSCRTCGPVELRLFLFWAYGPVGFAESLRDRGFAPLFLRKIHPRTFAGGAQSSMAELLFWSLRSRAYGPLAFGNSPDFATLRPNAWAGLRGGWAFGPGRLRRNVSSVKREEGWRQGRTVLRPGSAPPNRDLVFKIPPRKQVES